MRAKGLRAAIVVMTLVGGTAAHGMETPPDVSGWRTLQWGVPLSEALALFENARVVQERKSEIAGCYFQYAVPISVLGEDWDAWLCEDRDDQTIVAVNLEKGYRGGLFFDKALTRSGVLDGVLAEIAER